MEELIKHIIRVSIPDEHGNVKDIEIKLREPNFEDYCGAMDVAMLPSGKYSMLKQGKFIIDVCGIDVPDIVKKDTKAYVAASIEAAQLLGVYHAELKKK